MAKKSKQEALKVVEDYEITLRKAGALYADSNATFKTGSLEEFIIDFLYHNYESKNFSYTNRVGGNKVTKDTAYAGARRSIGDLFRLSLHYIGEDVKLLDVMKVMYIISNLPIKVGSYEIYNGICSTVNRRVFNQCNPGSNLSYRLNETSATGIQYSGSDEASISVTDYITLCGEVLQERRKLVAEEARKKAEEQRIAAELAKKQREEALRKQEEDRLERMKNAKENAIKQKLAEITTKHLTLDEQIAAKVAKMKEENHSKISLIKVVKKKRVLV